MGGLSGRRGALGALAIAALSLALSGCFYHRNLPWSGGTIGDPVVSQTFRVGPFDLAAMNQPGWERLGNDVMPRPAGDVALKEIAFDVVDAAGNRIGLDRVHLHHIVLIDTSEPDALCPSVGARFAGTGAERTRLTLLGDYAYRVDAGDVWRSTYHIHTTSMQAVDDVYIQYTVKYEPITATSTFKYTTPYFLDVTGCWSASASIYDVPGGGGPGSVHTASRTYTATRDGIAVWAGGHIHAGGFDVGLERVSTGEDYCTATASYQPGGHPSHPNLGQLQRISSCLLQSEIVAGEQYTVRARYDNEHAVLKAMGILLVHVHHL